MILKHHARGAALVLVTCSLWGCAKHEPDVKSLLITEANREKILDQISDSRELTVEEVRLLDRRVLKAAMANAFGQTASAFTPGQTLGQTIDQERQQEKEQQEADAKQKAAHAVKADANSQMRGRMTEALAVTVVDKAFVKADVQKGEFQDLLLYKVSYENKSGKSIRSFKGAIEFDDLFGATISRMQIQEDSPIPAHKSTNKVVSTDYNQYQDSDRQLNQKEFKNLKIVWQPEAILFEDGTSLKLDQ